MKKSYTNDAQARKLFSQLDAVAEALEAIKVVVNRVAGNSKVFMSVYHEHGSEIAKLKLKVDKLWAICPEVRPPTDEFSSVEGSDD